MITSYDQKLESVKNERAINMLEQMNTGSQRFKS